MRTTTSACSTRSATNTGLRPCARAATPPGNPPGDRPGAASSDTPTHTISPQARYRKRADRLGPRSDRTPTPAGEPAAPALNSHVREAITGMVVGGGTTEIMPQFLDISSRRIWVAAAIADRACEQQRAWCRTNQLPKSLARVSSAWRWAFVPSSIPANAASAAVINSAGGSG